MSTYPNNNDNNFWGNLILALTAALIWLSVWALNIIMD